MGGALLRGCAVEVGPASVDARAKLVLFMEIET